VIRYQLEKTIISNKKVDKIILLQILSPVIVIVTGNLSTKLMEEKVVELHKTLAGLGVPVETDEKGGLGQFPRSSGVLR
jgi:hypothetical protein